MTTKIVKPCSCPPTVGYCCVASEVAALRETVATLHAGIDRAIRILESEAQAEVIIDDGGLVREVMQHTTKTLRAARQVA